MHWDSLIFGLGSLAFCAAAAHHARAARRAARRDDAYLARVARAEARAAVAPIELRVTTLGQLVAENSQALLHVSGVLAAPIRDEQFEADLAAVLRNRGGFPHPGAEDDAAGEREGN